MLDSCSSKKQNEKYKHKNKIYDKNKNVRVPYAVKINKFS